MPTDNERFKVILHDAKVISLNKFQMVQGRFGANNADLVALGKELDNVIALFNDPAIWVSPISFSEEDITNFMLEIDQCDPGDLPKFLKISRDFIAYLKNKVLKPSSDERRSAAITDFNLKVLDALLIAQRNITGRKAFFKNQGTDLDTNSQFIPKQQAQVPVLAAYRSALNNNQVQSTESDVIIFKRIGEGIKQATVLTKFFAFYDMLTNTMKSKLPQV